MIQNSFSYSLLPFLPCRPAIAQRFVGRGQSIQALWFQWRSFGANARFGQTLQGRGALCECLGHRSGLFDRSFGPHPGMFQTSIGAHHHRSGRGQMKIKNRSVKLIPELFKKAGITPVWAPSDPSPVRLIPSTRAGWEVRL